MTALYLICYFIYKTFTSTLLSLLLGLRLLRRNLAPPATPKEAGNVIELYEGTVCHERRHPARNSFRLTTRLALIIDLDRPPYSPPNYLSADDARRAAKTNGPVHLLRIPPSVGYERSPVNYYYCYDIEGSTKIFKKCLVEGVNPWGESVTFVFNPSSDLVTKTEHISPFMDMSGKWRLKAKEPGENLNATISVEHPKFGNLFTANSLTAKRVITSSFMPEDLEAFFWLMPHKTSITTYWNGVKLWWKNVPFYEHPRKENPAYREEAAARDEKVRFCRAFGAAKEERIDRCFMWKDTKWPWS